MTATGDAVLRFASCQSRVGIASQRPRAVYVALRRLMVSAVVTACTEPGAMPFDASGLDRVRVVADDAGGCGVCDGDFASRGDAVRITSSALSEVSGVVESRRTPGVVFAHNDSGDSARFFALGAGGRKVGEYHLRGATAVDWEDLAIGPCDTGTCVFLGDIGDNDRVRGELVIYRVAEPLPADGDVDVPWAALPFRYPDGRHNAETLVAHPVTGDLYVITKETTGPIGVFVLRAPHMPGAVRTAERVASLNLPADGGQLVTGGDLHPCADRLLLRTYIKLYEYQRPADAPFEALFASPPRVVAFLPERQGEAVGWRVDGLGYVTISEGSNAPIHSFVCAGR